MLAARAKDFVISVGGQCQINTVDVLATRATEGLDLIFLLLFLDESQEDEMPSSLFI